MGLHVTQAALPDCCFRWACGAVECHPSHAQFCGLSKASRANRGFARGESAAVCYVESFLSDSLHALDAMHAVDASMPCWVGA